MTFSTNCAERSLAPGYCTPFVAVKLGQFRQRPPNCISGPI
jgi:hypothetical protein